ncbi:MAG: TatD family hydrolase [Bacteroidales bacterium]|nr:TatD family hydrolase [Bacteroidales bacterium]
MLLPGIDQYIDIHTHISWNYPHIFSIKSLVKPGEPETFRSINKPVSVGLHPWFINEMTDEDSLKLVAEASTSSQVLAVGECGFDLKKEIPIAHQEKVFLAQLMIAEQAQKPLIIHCVRAYHKVLELISLKKTTVPWIIHGFNHNEQIAGELVRQGAYLSVGADFLKVNSNIRKSIKSIPLDHLFLETDEWQQPVWKLYAEVAKVRHIQEKALKTQIFENFMTCFDKSRSGISK